MDAGVVEALRTAVKPDLNCIYTEPPHRLATGADMGWFCREHALHVFLLARLLGLEAVIVRGDIAVRSGTTRFMSMGSGADHAWCRVAGQSPVDVSVEFRYYRGLPPIDVVYGVGTSAAHPWSVQILQGGDAEKKRLSNLLENADHSIVYIERQVVDVTAIELLQDPWRFLLEPPAGMPRFTEIHGEDVFDRITQHCLKLVHGDAKPVSTFLTARDALARIKSWNGNARPQLASLLA